MNGYESRRQSEEDEDELDLAAASPVEAVSLVGLAAAPLTSVCGTPLDSLRNSFRGAASDRGRLHEAQEDREGGEEPGPTPREEAGDVVKVDRVPAMIGYFGYMCGCGAINAYYGLLLKAKGFREQHIGTLVACIPLSSIVLLPILTFIADRYNCARTMLVATAVATTVLLFGFTVTAGVWLTVVLYLLLIAAQTPMGPLLDQHTLYMFPERGRTAAWSAVRAYGAIGWGVGNPLSAVTVQLAGSWVSVVPQYALGQLALLYCVFVIRPYKEPGAITGDEAVEAGTEAETEGEPTRRRKPRVKFSDIIAVLRSQHRLLVFMAASMMMGMGYSFINNFLFIYLDSLGAPKVLLGMTIVLTVSTEVPIFQYSAFFQRWLTDRMMMSLAMSIWAARVMCYSFISQPWTVLLIEPLHGVTFSFMWLPSMHLVHTAFPQRLASSAQGFLALSTFGVGPVLGNLLAGWLYEAVGPHWMFRIASIAMAIALFVYLQVDWWLESKGYPLGEGPEGGEEEGHAKSEKSAAGEEGSGLPAHK